MFSTCISFGIQTCLFNIVQENHQITSNKIEAHVLSGGRLTIPRMHDESFLRRNLYKQNAKRSIPLATLLGSRWPSPCDIFASLPPPAAVVAVAVKLKNFVVRKWNDCGFATVEASVQIVVFFGRVQ